MLRKITPKFEGQLLTIPQAAKMLGVPVYALRRAVNYGHIPSYKLFDTRRRLILSEVLEVIQQKKEG